jgi:hypothetical protein
MFFFVPKLEGRLIGPIERVKQVIGQTASAILSGEPSKKRNGAKRSQPSHRQRHKVVPPLI